MFHRLLIGIFGADAALMIPLAGGDRGVVDIARHGDEGRDGHAVPHISYDIALLLAAHNLSPWGLSYACAAFKAASKIFPAAVTCAAID